jgi:hypothetical protein
MKPDWRRTAAARAIIRGGGRDMMAGTLAGLGGAIAIATMEWFSTTAHYPLAVIPFATSIVLVIGAPEAEPAQPRALVGGHLVATLVGLAVLWVTRPQAWAAALAVGRSILAMYLTGTFRPPAGINPLLVVSNNLPCSFLLAPLLGCRAGLGLLQREAIAVADQDDVALVEGVERRAVADRDDGGGRQLLDQQAVQRRLRGLIQRSGGLV